MLCSASPDAAEEGRRRGEGASHHRPLRDVPQDRHRRAAQRRVGGGRPRPGPGSLVGTGRRGPPALFGEGEGRGEGLTGQGSWGAGKDECHGRGGWGRAAVVPWRAPRLECFGPGGGACLEVLLEEGESPGERLWW